MSSIFQIGSSLIFIYWINIVSSTPLFQGFNVNKGFEVNLKPLELKPITFFKEKWSPIGIYGVQKGIVKRDLGIKSIFNRMVPPPFAPAPVFENVEELKAEEKKETAETSATNPSPNPIKLLSSNFISKPLGLYTNTGHDTVYVLPIPPQPPLGDIFGELPPKPVGPIPAQPAPIQPAAIQPAPIPASWPREVVPLITSPPPLPATSNVPEIPPTEGPLVRGSRVALYFGNVFLDMLSQFLTNARLKFSKPPPPPEPVPVAGKN